MVSLNILLGRARLVGVFALSVVMLANQAQAGKCEAGKTEGLGLYAPPIAIYRSAAGLGGPVKGEGRNPGVDTWRKTAESLGEPLPGERFESYFLCKFDYATQILEQRRKRLGDAHPYVRVWLRNQNAVFQACRGWGGESGPGPEFVGGFGEEIDALARADIAYQKAAWKYYDASKNFSRNGGDRLKIEFGAIARDMSSPHRPFAAYMVALIDSHLSHYGDEGLRKTYEEAALAGIQQILADPTLAPAHRITRQLNDMRAYNTLDAKLLESQVVAMGKALSRPARAVKSNPAFAKDLQTAESDLAWFTVAGPANGPRTKALKKQAVNWPVLDWIRLYEAGQHRRGIDGWIDPSNPAGDGWIYLRAAATTRFLDHQEPLWALPLAGLAAPDDKRVDTILQVFDRQHQAAITCSLPPAQSALEGELLKQSVRLLLQRGEIERAVTVLEEEAEYVGGKRWQATAKLAVQWLVAHEEPDFARRILALFPARDADVASLRQVVARTLTEFLDAVPDSVYPESTGAVLNLLPLDKLMEAASNPDLPINWRAAIARVAWIRALLLDGMNGARRVTPILAVVDKATGQAMAKADNAWGQAHARRLAALAVARRPGMNLEFEGVLHRYWYHLSWAAKEPDLTAIDLENHSDGNWWCPLDPEWARMNAGEKLFDRAVGAFETEERIAAVRERTLADHPVLRLANTEELYRLSRVPSGPKFLAETAVDWAKSKDRISALSGRDRGLAELLALAVKSTRYGCERAGGHGKYSRAAYEALHKKFPTDPYTTATPYWFDCENFRRGCVGRYSRLDLSRSDRF